MKFNRMSSSAVLAAALVALLALAACGGAQKAEKRVLRDASYQSGTTLPDRVENLSGTALFSVNEELAVRLGAAGANAPGGIDSFFVLLNSKAPTEGVLVRAGSAVPRGLIQHQDSRKLTVTGDVKALEDPSLLTHVQERLGITLARNDQGKPVWIDNEAKLELDAPPAAEGAGASPATPAAGGSEPPSPGSASPGEPGSGEASPGAPPSPAGDAPGTSPSPASEVR